MAHDIIIGMAGSGGDGIVSAGESMTAAATLEGYHAILTKSFGSQIRGGESSFRLRISTRPVRTPGGTLDVAVALNWDDFMRFGAELPVGGQTTVIYDSATGVPPDRLPLGPIIPREALAVPLGEIARTHVGSEKGKNSVVMGLVAGYLGLPQDRIVGGMRKKLEKKGAELFAANVKAFEAGMTWALEHPLAGGARTLQPAPAGPRKLLVDGNEMCAAAAIFAGCRFFGGYPITPSSEIMQYLGREIWKYGGSVVQAEDEIAGVGTALGASFAGIKSMTATSGPGMALKSEILGLATIAELPLVCVNVQRGGPSTGLPTKSEQADLYQAAFSAHGDAPRPVLAPTCVADTFRITVEAFNTAEQYQTPVIVLSDQEIAQRKDTVDPIDTSRFEIVNRREPAGTELEPYKRFRLTESGISPLSRPGLAGGNYLASGIEHTESGAPTASGEVHARMNEKRARKLLPLQKRADLFQVFGDPAAPLAMVAWGSLAGVGMDALELAHAEGLRVKLLVPLLLYPVAEEVYRDFFASVSAGLFVEQSHQGQLYRVVRMHVDVPRGVVSYARSGANPILPATLRDRLRGQALSLQRTGIAESEPQLG